MFKNLLTALMCMVSLAVYADGTKVGDYYYLFDATTGEASITCGSGNYSGSVIVPETVTVSGTSYSVTSVDAFAFSDCTELTSVTLPSSITVIGWGAFSGCSSLKNVTLGTNVSLIAPEAFSGCTALTTIKSNNDAAPSIYHASTVDGVNHTADIFVQPTAINTYKNAFVWKDFSNIKDVHESVIELDLYDGTGYVKTVEGDFETAKELLATAAKNSFVFTSKEVSSTDELPANVVAVDANGDYVAKEINLTDAIAFHCPADIKADKVTYTRNFKNTNYQALYLPYDINISDFAEIGKISYINNVHQYDDDDNGTVDRTVIEFISKKSGTLRSNTPYIVQANATGTQTVTSNNVTIKETAEDGWIDCMSTTYRYVMTGTYQTTEMYYAGHYGMTNGSFKTVVSTSVTLSPFRFYLDVIARSGEGSVNNAPKVIKISVDGVEEDDDPTGIENINTNSVDNNYYDLHGRKVLNPTTGIYIHNGKKIQIK